MASTFGRLSRSLYHSSGATISSCSRSSLSLRSTACLVPSQLVATRSIVYKLFVGGLSYYTSEKNLAEAFSQFGQVIEAKVITERGSERSKGFGFVTYASEDGAQKAIEEMDGKELNGRVVHVDIAKANQSFDRNDPVVARGPPEYEGGLADKVQGSKNRELEKP